MRQKILFILLLIAATVAGNRLSAQTFPVQAGLMMQPPYSVYLSDYTAVGSHRLAISLLLQDMSRADLPVRLRFHIEGQGFSLRTKEYYLPTPITLESGIPLRLGGDELAGYLAPQNLQVLNGNENAFLRTGKLPEGVYRFCVEVLEYNRNSVVSNPGCATGWLLLNDPPLLNRPGKGEKLRAQEPQNIPFNWTPLHTGSPNSAFSTQYEFTLVEVWPANRNPNDAILSTAPIYQVTTPMTSLHYGMAEPPLEPGRTYAWRVRAMSMTGVEEMDLFKNEGYSEVRSFQWGEVCTAPQGLEVEQYGTTRLKLSWEASPEQSEFIVRYRLQGSEEGWQEETTFLTEHTIGSLQPETSYEVQVVGLCASVTGGTSLTVIGQTAVDRFSEFACGADPGLFDLDNSSPLPELRRGDYIQAGDLEVRVDSVGGSNGTFSGIGVTGLPFLNLIQVRVRFNDIRVNTDYRMFEGHIVTIWDPNSRSVVNIGGDDVLEEGEAGDTPAGGETGDDFEGIDITYEGVADSVYVNDDGQIVVVDESGEETQYEPEPDTDTRITDSEGNVYVVDSEGNVTKGDSAAAGTDGGSTPDTGGNSADSLQYIIAFGPSGEQVYGFDAYPSEHAVLAGNYELTEINGEPYRIPWKSVLSGRIDPVQLLLPSDTLDVSKLRFAYESGQEIPLIGNEESGYMLNLSASGHEQLMPVMAYHTEEDDEEGELAGKLNLISYNGITKKVVLVPVNGAGGSLPNATSLNQQLNEIFGPAAANWEVSIHEGFEATAWDRNESGSLDDGSTGLLSNYTREMRRLVKAFMEVQEEDEDAFYLFLVEQSESGSKLGYMPRKQRYGFIFTGHSQHQSEVALVKTIGHELGHGAFRLEHTYNTYPSLAKGSTDNLMDKRARGAELRKYQWDLVHNPVTVWGILEDDEDGEMAMNEFITDANWVDKNKVPLNVFYYGENKLYLKLELSKSCKGKNIKLRIEELDHTFNNSILESDLQITHDNLDLLLSFDYTPSLFHKGGEFETEQELIFKVYVDNSLDYYDERKITITHAVVFIPDVMKSLGWVNGEKIQKEWFNGNETNYPWDGNPKLDYLGIEWIISAPRIRSVYNEVVTEIWKDDDALTSLGVEINDMINDGFIAKPTAENPEVDFGVFDKRIVSKLVDKEEVKPNQVNERMPLIEKYYYKNISFEESLATGMDDHYATIANFNFRIAAKGKLKYISENDIEVNITEIAIYVKDAFDYLNNQPLGKWNLEDGKVSKIPLVNYYSISNSDYRKYRDASKKGGDFYWYSEIKVVDVSRQEVSFKL